MAHLRSFGRVSADHIRGAGVHVPPLFYFAVPFVIGYSMHRIWPGDRLPMGLALRMVVGGVLLAAGLMLAGSAIAWFLRLRVSPLPFRPASSLVCRGPYRITRNPMYVGLAFAYAGLAFLLNTAWPLALLPVGVFLVDRWVILPEERYLRTAFTGEFAEFSARVRRWL